MRFLICLLFAAAAGSARAAPVFEDTMAQRTLACTGCHGQQGRAGPDGYYPRLAGDPGAEPAAGNCLRQRIAMLAGSPTP